MLVQGLQQLQSVMLTISDVCNSRLSDAELLQLQNAVHWAVCCWSDTSVITSSLSLFVTLSHLALKIRLTRCFGLHQKPSSEQEAGTCYSLYFISLTVALSSKLAEFLTSAKQGMFNLTSVCLSICLSVCLFDCLFVKVKVYSASLWITTSEVLRYGTCSQGISQFYLHTHTFICNQNEPYLLCLPSYNWYSFTNPGGMEGWVDLGAK